MILKWIAILSLEGITCAAKNETCVTIHNCHLLTGTVK